MNAITPRSERRKITPLMWASGGTLLLHSALLLALWLWPQSPAKPRETLLEVDLKSQKLAPTVKPKLKPTPKPKPTLRPLKVVRPRVLHLLKPKPHPSRKPKIVIKTRVDKANIPKTRPTLVPPPTPIPIPTVAPRLVKVPKVKPTAPLKTVKPPPVENPTPVPPVTKANTNDSATTRAARKAKGKTVGSGSLSQPAAAPDHPTPPSGGAKGRRLASNNAPKGDEDNAARNSGAPSSADKGHNSLGHSDETAGAEPGINLPHTRTRRGRTGPVDAPSGTAPTRSKDGTEPNVGPSAPTSSSGGSRRAALDTGTGEDDSGVTRRGGMPQAEGFSNLGRSERGHGAGEAVGAGVSGGTRGSGARGNGRRGRSGSRLAGDPFGGNEGKGGQGAGKGNGAGDGVGSGPSRGTRIARRGGDGTGEGDGDGQYGRGTGPGRGNGLGAGDGNIGHGTGTSSGRGGSDSADDAGSGRSRSRRGGTGHRAIEVENEIGRGIWGGFKMSFYQDKSRYPDNVDTRTIQGKPIDWQVFSGIPHKTTSKNLDFDWGTTPPIEGLKSTFWSMKASGVLFVPKDDTYHFFFDELDDGGRLFLDGTRIINIWNVQKSTPTSEGKFLKRGRHDIQIEYVQGPATEASIKLSWSSTSFPKEIIGVYKESR